MNLDGTELRCIGSCHKRVDRLQVQEVIRREVQAVDEAVGICEESERSNGQYEDEGTRSISLRTLLILHFRR